MGLERHLNKTFLGESKALDRRWVVKALDIEEAANKVVSFCKEELARLESEAGGNIDIDLSFKELEEVTEL